MVLSFVRVHTSIEFTQAHLKRKFMAFCDIKFLLRNPPLTGTRHTCRIQVGAGMTFGLAWTTCGLVVHEDCHGAIIGVGGGLKISQHGAVGVI
jgi:hypothetical protein